MSRTLLPPLAAPLADGARRGGWWHADTEPGRIVCDLCPRECALRPGDRGFCFVRENRSGEMVLSTYGKSTGFCIDPIEKKPLNHFYPGTSVLSFGTAGCNLGCKFCQNWSISKSREIERLSESAEPESIAAAAQQLGCKSVAFTYNDPVVWAEYAIDSARACRAAGVKTVAVTAGYITPEARGPFFEFMDAANVDLKGFTEEFYQKLTLSHLQPVLDTLRWLKHESNVWFEVTNLIIPNANDDSDELRRMCDWVLENLGPEVPLHFTAFHPDFRLNDRPATPAATLLNAYRIATSLGLKYVYVGNIHAPREQTTYCPNCRTPLIERVGYELPAYRMHGDHCRHCQAAIAGRFDQFSGSWGSRRQPVRISQWSNSATQPAGRELVQIAENVSDLSLEEPRNMATTSDLAREASLSLATAQQQAVLHAAVEVLVAAVEQRRPRLDPALAGAANWPVLGAFVTAKRCGKLRGCCGSLGATLPLLQAIVQAAERTAHDDPRFPPISPSELPYLDLDVWLLSNQQPVAARGEARREMIEIGKHGLSIARGQQRGLLLPGVALEHHLGAEQFLEHVCQKAGLPATAWKEADTQLWTFEGQELQGRMANLATFEASPKTATFAARDLAILSQFCRNNIAATVTGATPSFFAYGAADGGVNGVVITLHLPGGRQMQASRVSLRESLPLQSTLHQLAGNLGQSLQRQPNADQAIEQARVSLTILIDPALHGTLHDPDLRGLDSARAVLAMQRSRSALVFDPSLAPEERVSEATGLGGFTELEGVSLLSFGVVSNEERVSFVQSPQPQHGPAVRPPAVAGTFYPGDLEAMHAELDDLLSGPAVEQRAWPAVLVPHAGWRYSGRIAAEVLRRVEIPDTVIVLSPKHTPHGVDWSVAPHAQWAIPGGAVASDPALAAELCAAIPGLELDAAAHAQEHGIEVELPLLARLAPKAKVVGIVIGSSSLARAQKFAVGLAKVLKGRAGRTSLIISSDMNHYASDAENRRLDELALGFLDRLDPAGLYAICKEKNISMCGLVPAVIVLETLKLLGQLNSAERIAYGTSADVSGDTSRVVGYAGMLFG